MKNKMEMKRIITLVITLFYVFCIEAQFVQRGVTLEYNRNKAKTTYTKPVSIRTDNAEPSVSNNGSFTLTFTKSIIAGDTIKSPVIRVGDEKYVLFNKNRIQGWVLTPKKDLEVLVCKKEIIDYLESTYTNNYVNQLKKRYEQSQRRLRASTEDTENLKKELTKLRADYDREVNMIRARAVLFAYVDETEKDSLELLRRECILNNDLERALEIGDEMDLGGLANSYMTNLHKSKDVYARYLQNLHDLATILEEQIQIYKTKDKYNLNGALTPYYESLTEVYKCLLEEYKDSKRYEILFNDIEDKLGEVLYVQDKIEEAAQYDNTDALYSLANIYDSGEEKEDSAKCKSYLRQLLYAIQTKGRDLPQSSYILYDYVEWLESFTDFSINVDGAKFEYAIINDHEVCLAHYTHGTSKARKVIIPQEVVHKGKTYTVTKVGRWAFYLDSSLDEDEHDFREIKLPNSITHVGFDAFHSKWRGTIKVNMPSSLKVIRDHAYYGCEFKNDIIEIPDGVEHVGDAWDTWNELSESKTKGLTLRIPASVKEINAMTELNLMGNEFFCQPIKAIELHPDNKNFRMMHGLLYTADSSHVYAGGLYRLNNCPRILYIPRQLRFPTDNDLETTAEFFQSDVVRDYTDSLVVDINHPDFSLYNGILYDKKLERIILRPLGVKKIIVPATLKEIENEYISGSYNGTYYYFPKDVNPDVFIDIMLDHAKEDTTTFEYYGIKEDLFYNGMTERLVDLVKFIDRTIASNPKETKLHYIKGRLLSELFDFSSVENLLQQTKWDNDLFEKNLETHLEKNRITADSLRQVISSTLQKRLWGGHMDYYWPIDFQKRFARQGLEKDVYDLALLYYLRGERIREDKDDFYQEKGDCDCRKAIDIILEYASADSSRQKALLSSLYLHTAIQYYNYDVSRFADIVERNLKLSLAANPDNIVALEVMGSFYLHKDEPEKAKVMLEKMREIDEDFANGCQLKTKLEGK